MGSKLPTQPTSARFIHVGLTEAEGNLDQAQANATVVFEIARHFNQLSNDFYSALQAEEDGNRNIHEAIRAMVFLFLRNKNADLEVTETPPYFSLNEQALDDRRKTLWQAWISLAMNLPSMQSQLESVRDRVIEYSSLSSTRLAYTRKHIEELRHKPADAVLLLSPVYCNNDLAVAVRDSLRSTRKQVQRTLAAVSYVPTYYRGQLFSVARQIEEFAVLPTQEFLKKCADLPADLNVTRC